MPQLAQKYSIGKEFTEEQYTKWMEQLTWWISSRMPNIENPTEHAKTAIKAALNGTKLNGEAWPTISNDFYKRMKQLVGFDLEKGIGIREPSKGPNTRRSGRNEVVLRADELPPIDMEKAMGMRNDYINDLIAKYPHLDTPVYKPKVEELAETIVKSRMISNDFLTSRGQQLERLSKIRESLHKQIGELMEFLEISPKQRVTKSLDAKNADVGSLVSRIESYGETWLEFERIDAIRELIQIYRMLKSSRPDGTKQLNDWEIWHMTRTRPAMFTCRHGETYEVIDGFTPEEIEQALLQAQEVYGFGLEGIEKSIGESNQNVMEAIVEFETLTEPPQKTDDADPDITED